MNRSVFPITLALAFTACMPPPVLHAALNYRAVALSGQQAPGTPTGAVFGGPDFLSTFGFPQINDAGKVSFRAFLETGPGGVNNENSSGLWFEDSGTLSLLVRAGEQAVGMPAGVNFGGGFHPILNSAGQIAFVGSLQLGSGGITFDNDGGIWAESSGSLELIVRGGTPAPGTPPGVIFDALGIVGTDLLFNDAGQIAFSTLLAFDSSLGVTLDSMRGIWMKRSSALELVARQGSQAPGVPAGVNFEEFGGYSHEVQLNNAGHLTFWGRLETGVAGITNANSTGIWSDRSGALDLLVRGGDQPPGLPAGAAFVHLLHFTSNDAGRIAFTATLKTGSGGVVTGNASGIWSEGSDGTLSLVARAGDQAPGVPNGLHFNLFNSLVLSDDGEAAFKAQLSGGVAGLTAANNDGVWLERSGVLEMIAREGDQAPGTPDGAVFTRFFDPVFDGQGRVLFVADLLWNFGGVLSGNDRGMWALDAQGTLSLVLRKRDVFEVTPGDFRTITAFAGGLSNSNGLAAFRLEFADGSSGVFTALIPEPASFALLGLGGLGLHGRSRRTR